MAPRPVPALDLPALDTLEDTRDLISSSDATRLLGGARISAYAYDRVMPVARVSSQSRSGLLFRRSDIEALRDEIRAKLVNQLAAIDAAENGL
jgi:hypothetical protein